MSQLIKIGEFLEWACQRPEVPRDCGVVVTTERYPYTGFPLGTDKHGIMIAKIGSQELWWIAIYASRGYTHTVQRRWVACVCKVPRRAVTESGLILLLNPPMQVTAEEAYRIGLSPELATQVIHGYLSRKAGAVNVALVEASQQEPHQVDSKNHWREVVHVADTLARTYRAIGTVERSPFWQEQAGTSPW